MQSVGKFLEKSNRVQSAFIMDRKGRIKFEVLENAQKELRNRLIFVDIDNNDINNIALGKGCSVLLLETKK